MDELTITEALYSLAAEESDATNIIGKVRRAQARIVEGHLFGSVDELHTLRSQDEVDDLLIMASRNGSIDLFA